MRQQTICDTSDSKPLKKIKKMGGGLGVEEGGGKQWSPPTSFQPRSAVSLDTEARAGTGRATSDKTCHLTARGRAFQ